MTVQPPAAGGWETPADLSVGPAPGVKFAGPGARLIGYIIDTVIIGVVGTVVLAVIGVLTAVAGMNDAGLFAGIGFLLAFLAWFAFYVAYFPYFWARTGQTPGMKFTNIKVVRDADGGPVTLGPAILRLIGYWISSIVLYIGFIWVLIDKRRRGWFDLIAGTCVIEA
jgi:uncharacterized RDD family membrane protein YckC